MIRACKDCEHLDLTPIDEPCISCLGPLHPGKTLVFQNFEWAKEEGEEGTSSEQPT